MLYAPSGGLVRMLRTFAKRSKTQKAFPFPLSLQEPGQPYKKVAVVENFFDIIYGVHVSLGSRATRHAGQKRTYRTVRRMCNEH